MFHNYFKFHHLNIVCKLYDNPNSDMSIYFTCYFTYCFKNTNRLGGELPIITSNVICK